MTDNTQAFLQGAGTSENDVQEALPAPGGGRLRRILSYVRRAVDDYRMIEEGDAVAVGISGGKDSLALLCALSDLRIFYPKHFTLHAIHLDPAFYAAGFCDEKMAKEQIDALRRFSEGRGVPFHVIDTHIAEIIFRVRREQNPCSLCARMRRGALHHAAKELGCGKIALGHHFDDAVETFFMNLFNEGRLGCFSPVTYLDRSDITVIRPLVYCPEKSIRYFAAGGALPVIESPCPADRDSERQRVKELLRQLEKDYDGLKHRVFGAMVRAGLDGFGTDGDRDGYGDGKDAAPASDASDGTAQ